MKILHYNTVFTQEPRCVSAHDNRLPFCKLCPCASATILGKDAAVFHRHAQLGPLNEEMLY